MGRADDRPATTAMTWPPPEADTCPVCGVLLGYYDGFCEPYWVNALTGELECVSHVAAAGVPIPGPHWPF